MFGWDQVCTIIAVNATLVGILAGWITWVINRLDTDIRDVKSSVTQLDKKLDTVSSRMDARFESQSARTDRLYEMFVDLLKEKNK